MFMFKLMTVELILIHPEAFKYSQLKNICIFIVCARSEPGFVLIQED